jgi:hypothetical protein
VFQRGSVTIGANRDYVYVGGDAGRMVVEHDPEREWPAYRKIDPGSAKMEATVQTAGKGGSTL